MLRHIATPANPLLVTQEHVLVRVLIVEELDMPHHGANNIMAPCAHPGDLVHTPTRNMSTRAQDARTGCKSVLNQGVLPRVLPEDNSAADTDTTTGAHSCWRLPDAHWAVCQQHSSPFLACVLWHVSYGMCANSIHGLMT